MPPRLQISPIDSYIDEEIMIKVVGCEKHSQVTIHATTHDEMKKKFCSYATFVSDHEGSVDVSLQKPLEGTYDQIDQSGLFWSMEHADSKLGDYYEKRSSDKISINLVLKQNEKELDSVTINRYFYMDDVVKESIEDKRIKGMLFHPKKVGKYPAVIILSGSDGGIQEHAAALLASKGFITVALAYFGAEGVPKDLQDIPLEYFHEATLWLKKHPYSNGEVSLIGYSRGGELALLLGSTFDCYQSIIAGVPSAYRTPGMKNGVFAPVTSWTYNQQELPYIKLKYRFSTMISLLRNWILKKPVSYVSVWDHTLKNGKDIDKARIAVENIHAPVMFICGEDDQLWPSGRFVKIIEEKLQGSRNSYANRYLYYKDAGHFLSFPYSIVNLPANIFINEGRMVMNFGGTKLANAKAAEDSWNQILEFLERSKS